MTHTIRIPHKHDTDHRQRHRRQDYGEANLQAGRQNSDGGGGRRDRRPNPRGSRTKGGQEGPQKTVISAPSASQKLYRRERQKKERRPQQQDFHPAVPTDKPPISKLPVPHGHEQRYQLSNGGPQGLFDDLVLSFFAVSSNWL